MSTLVLIHGRAQGGKDPVALQQTWERTWERGLAEAGLARPPGVDVRFPYYGDTLDRLVDEIEGPWAGLPRGEVPDQTELLVELALEMADEHELPDAAILAELPPDGPIERGPENWEWVQGIFRALEKHLGMPLIQRIMKDVWAYLTFPQVQREVDAIIRPTLTEDAVVIGHSLGSVVGYNLLREAAAPQTRSYVTLGSPLGMKSIKRRLIPLRSARAGDWYNAYDERDVVALRALSGNLNVPSPAIEDANHVDNHTDNRHGIVGYLDDPTVAARVHQALV